MSGIIYHSKPSKVEAVMWTGFNVEEVSEFVDVKSTGAIDYSPDDDDRNHPLQLRAGQGGAQGWVDVPAGHWIVRKPNDYTDHWPVDPVYFAEKYQHLTDEDNK